MMQAKQIKKKYNNNNERAPVKFNPRVRRLFLETYAKTGNISASVKACKISRATFYLTKGKDPEFAAQVEDVKIEAIENLELEARERATRGGVKKVYYEEGQIVGREYYPPSDLLMIFLLKALKPEMYREHTDVSVSGDIKMNSFVELSRAIKNDNG